MSSISLAASAPFARGSSAALESFRRHEVAALVVLSVFGARELGDFLMVDVKAQGYATRDMSELLVRFGIRAFWSLASIYLLTVSMRILGTLYATNRQEFGWFAH